MARFSREAFLIVRIFTLTDEYHDACPTRTSKIKGGYISTLLFIRSSH